MAYPWPSFGSFQFNASERPSIADDTGWVANISATKSRALGAISDSIVLTSLGSRQRDFSIYLDEDRLLELQALVGTTAPFCDWKRPTPDSRTAFLDAVVQGSDLIRVGNSRGLSQTDQRRKVRVSLTSQ